MKYLILLTAVSASYSTFAVAQTQRDLDSHVHGSASLNVAIADSLVFIELNTPWNNLVGFEHAPESDEQHTLVDEALKQLNDPTGLFLFDAGDCAIEEVLMENSMSSDSHDDHGDEHSDEHDDDHGDEHTEEHDDDHGDEHSDDDEHAHEDEHSEESSTHTTVLVTYSYACKQVDELKSIDLTLFSIWSGFEDLDVQLIGAKGQALDELSQEKTVLNLESVK